VKAMKIHPIAKQFPALSAKEYKELLEDIKANGVKIPVLVNKKRDTILDGRSRWMAAHDLGLKDKQVPLEVFKGKDDAIPGEILSRNILRRHLTTDQRLAMIVMVRGDDLEAEAKERMTRKADSAPTKSSEQTGDARGKLAKEAGVSAHKAQQALRARRAGMLRDVVSGKLSLRKAAGKPRKQRPAKERSFEQIVWARWATFMRHWPLDQRRAVKELVRGFIATDKDDVYDVGKADRKLRKK